MTLKKHITYASGINATSSVYHVTLHWNGTCKSGSDRVKKQSHCFIFSKKDKKDNGYSSSSSHYGIWVSLILIGPSLCVTLLSALHGLE